MREGTYETSEQQLRIKHSTLSIGRTLRALTLVSRLVLGLMFSLAGLVKLGVPQAMAESIKSYSMSLPPGLVTVMASVLPPLELGVGIWILLGLFTRFSAGITALLMAIFTVAVTQAWFRGLDINCGCFGGPDSNALGKSILVALGPVGTFLTNEKAGPETVARDILLLLMSLHLVFVPTIFSIDQWRHRRNAIENTEDIYGDEAVLEEEPVA